MAKLLYKIGRSAYTYRLRFIAVWILIIIGMGLAASSLAKPTSSNFSIPGLESVQAQDKIKERFNSGGDAIDAPTGTAVIQAPEGKKLSDPDVAAEVDKLVNKLKDSSALKEKDGIANPVLADAGMRQQGTEAKKAQGLSDEQIKADLDAVSPLSDDARTGTIEFKFDAKTSSDVTDEQLSQVRDIMQNDKDDLKIGYTGLQSREIGNQSEIIGIIVAAIVLLITFGSLVAAGLPLITAMIGVSLGLAGISAATGFTDTIDAQSNTLASMIGLAVGIDYALFILSRFRSELIDHVDGSNLTPKELSQRLRSTTKEDRAHVAGLAVGKAGSAVLFAGLTVFIALVALSIINIPFLTAMALCAAGTVAIAVTVAISLLPAILGLCGTRAFAVSIIPFVKAPDPEQEKPTMGLRWIRTVRKQPTLFLVGSVLILGLLAIPIGKMQLTMDQQGTASLNSPERTAYEMQKDAFGPGKTAPMIALVDTENLPEQERMKAYAAAVDKFHNIDGVKNAQVIAVNNSSDAAQLLITPEYDSSDKRSATLLKTIRESQGSFKDETKASYVVTGTTPIFEDVSKRLSDALIPYVSIVVVLAFLLLMLVFRSIWVPLLAALGFALSVAATFGVTVGIWQEGMFGLISDPHPLLSFLPIFLIGIVFGLAMDYQVFLVTRMREGYAHGKTAGNAVSNGFKHGARVVTAAALIMISVFAAFTTMDQAFIKVMGFALALAVFLDAFIVRMTVIPATMFLLGDRAWKIPGWLNRILPNIDVEGEALTKR